MFKIPPTILKHFTRNNYLNAAKIPSFNKAEKSKNIFFEYHNFMFRKSMSKCLPTAQHSTAQRIGKKSFVCVHVCFQVIDANVERNEIMVKI